MQALGLRKQLIHFSASAVLTTCASAERLHAELAASLRETLDARAKASAAPSA